MRAIYERFHTKSAHSFSEIVRDLSKKELLDWMQTSLGSVRVAEIKAVHSQSEHPIVITAQNHRQAKANRRQTLHLNFQRNAAFYTRFSAERNGTPRLDEANCSYKLWTRRNQRLLNASAERR